jgi:hypothetical protein
VAATEVHGSRWPGRPGPASGAQCRRRRCGPGPGRSRTLRPEARRSRSCRGSGKMNRGCQDSAGDVTSSVGNEAPTTGAEYMMMQMINVGLGRDGCHESACAERGRPAELWTQRLPRSSLGRRLPVVTRHGRLGRRSGGHSVVTRSESSLRRSSE